MKIGIAGLPEYTENYRKALQLAAAASRPGARTPFSLTCEVSLLPEKARDWDALLLPGGGDIDPKLLPEKKPLTAEEMLLDPDRAPFHSPLPDPRCRNIDPELDRRQTELLDRFVKSGRPVLGICKGMQLISLYFGGGFSEHLPEAAAHRYIQYDQLHSTHAEKGSFLADLYGVSFVVNSAHHQGVTGCGRGLRIIQKSGDNVAEGLVHETLPVIGLQWHPERLCGRFARPGAVDGSRIFLYFLSLCSAGRKPELSAGAE